MPLITINILYHWKISAKVQCKCIEKKSKFIKHDVTEIHKTVVYLYNDICNYTPPPHPTRYKYAGCVCVCVGGILESLHPPVRVSKFVQTISPEPLHHFLTKLGIVVYYHEVECHAEKLVHCLQCQGHSEGI